MLIGGFLVLNRNSAVATALFILAAIFGILAMMWFVLLIVVAKRPSRTLTPTQRSNLTTYLQVSRWVRGAVGGVLGIGIATAGILLAANGNGYGFWILGFGVLSMLLTGFNPWLGWRIGRDAPPPTI